MSAPHSPSRISRNPLKAPLLRRICSIPAMAITSRVSHVYVARALTAPPLPGGARCIPMPRGIVRHVDTLPLGGDAPPDPPGRRPGAAAYPVSAARQDQVPGIAERAGHVGHRRRPRRGQPPRHPGRLPSARHGPDRGRPLDADQAGGCPASAAARDDAAVRDHAAARDDAAHRLRPHASAGSSPARSGGFGDRPADAARRAPAARRGPRLAPRPGQRGPGDPGGDGVGRHAARAHPARRGRRGRGRARRLGGPLPSAADLLRRHGFLRAGALAAMGVPGGPPPVAGDWLADPTRWAALRRELAEAVGAHAKRDPLAIGMPPEAARAALGLPDRALIEALAQDQVQLKDGYLRPAESVKVLQSAPSLPQRLLAAVRAVLTDLAAAPFIAPEAGRLRELGLDSRAIAAAARAGLLLRVTEQIVLAPGAQAEAARLLARLPQPFTTAEARQALGTTRRVAIPLLEYLDRAGITQRLPDDRRRLRLGAGTSPVWCGSARGSESQRLRNSGERRRASATRRAVPKVLTTRRNTRPPPWTPKTEAPGWSAIEMVAYMSWLFRTVTRRSPLLSTW